MVYVPNPDDITQPTDPIIAETAAAEFRALKTKILSLQGFNQAWNPADKTTNLLLGGSNTAAYTDTGITGVNGVRALQAVQLNQRLFWELTINSIGTVVYVGAAKRPAALGSILGSDSYGVSWSNLGQYKQMGVATGSVPAAVFGAGDTLGMLMDSVAGVLHLYKNGVLVSSLTFTVSDGAGIYPAVQIGDSLGTTFGQITANFGASPFIYTYPAAYSSFIGGPIGFPGVQNVLINSNMAFNQINGLTPVTPASGDYVADGWRYTATQANKIEFGSNLGTVATGLAALPNYLGADVQVAVAAPGAADNFEIAHPVEGACFYHFGFGTANPQNATLMFNVRSSITGQFSGCIRNAAKNRSYPFAFAIGAADTMEAFTFNIPGDIAGVWPTNANEGMEVVFDLGSGTNFQGTNGAWVAGNICAVTASQKLVAHAGATFDITGVELRAGNWNIRNYPEILPPPLELMRCQRYYYYAKVWVGQTGVYITSISYPTAMRVAPTIAGGGAGFATVSTDDKGAYFSQTAGAVADLTFDAQM